MPRLGENFVPLQADDDAALLFNGMPMEESRSFYQLLESGVRSENLTLNAGKWATRNREFEEVLGYSAFDDRNVQEWVKLYPDDFMNSVSPEESQAIVSRIKETLEDQRILDEAGFAGFAARILGGLPSLENIIPVGLFASAVTRTGRAVTKGATALAIATKTDDAIKLGARLTKEELRALKAQVPTRELLEARRAARANSLRRKKEAFAAREVERKRLSKMPKGPQRDAAFARLRSRELPGVVDGILVGGESMSLDNASRLLNAQKRAFDKLDEAKLAISEALKKGEKELLGAGVVSTGVQTGLAASAVGGGTEVALQAMQQGREDEYIANAFVASAILGGLIGTAGGKFQRATNRKILDAHLGMVDDMTFGDVLSRMPEAAKFTPEDFARLPQPKAAEGLMEKIANVSPEQAALIKKNGDDMPRGRLISALMHLNPGARLAKSRSKTASLASQALLPMPFIRRGEGAVAVDSRIVGHSVVSRSIATKVAALRKGFTGGSPEDFNRAVTRMLAQDKIPNGVDPRLREATKLLKDYFGDWNQKLRNVGLLTGQDDLGADKGYITRLLNHDAIESDFDEFVQAITPYVGGRDNAVKITDDILGHGSMSLDNVDVHNFLKVTRASQLKERGLKSVPREVIDKYLFNDLDYILDRYSRQVGAQYEYKRLFPNESVQDALTLAPLRRQIEADYDELRAAAKTAKERVELNKLQARDLKDLEYVRQSQIGFGGRDPFNHGSRVVAGAVTAATGAAFLGNAGFNTLTDITGAAFVNGARSFWRTALNKVSNPLSLLFSSKTKNELARQVRLLELAGADHSRSGMYFDFIAGGADSPKQSVLKKIHNGFMTANLLRPITAFAKEYNVLASQDALLRAAVDLVNGKQLSRAQLNNLKLAGLDNATALKIGRKALDGGAEREAGGLMLGKLDEWGDLDLQETFRAAVIQNVKRGVPTPTAGELPIFFGNDLGRILFQFWSFPLGATNNLTISGLQRRDAAVYMGMMMMTGLGIFIEAANAKLRGEEGLDINTLVFDGFERMGGMGVISNFNHMLSRTTAGNLDLAHLFGAQSVAERFGPIENIGDIVPGAALVERLATDAKTASRLWNGEPVTDQRIRTFSRRLPGMSGVHFTPIRELIEDYLKRQQ